jgi:hypothetical protein
LQTDILEDQQYLEIEIASGNPYVREATVDEIRDAKMRMDPKGTIRAELRPEVEKEICDTLEALIQQEMDATQDGKKIASVDAVRNVIEKLRKGRAEGTVVTSGTGTVIMDSKPAPLQGIVTSDKLAGAAAGSAN